MVTMELLNVFEDIDEAAEVPVQLVLPVWHAMSPSKERAREGTQ
jgi:hypothetical protein